jgi:hypothetical protein
LAFDKALITTDGFSVTKDTVLQATEKDGTLIKGTFFRLGFTAMEKAQEDASKKINEKAAAVGFLTNQYELRVYSFEVFESLRKLLLVGIPVFLVPYSLEQLSGRRVPRICMHSPETT